MLNLEIPKENPSDIETCLESYFNEKTVSDYRIVKNGKEFKTQATHRQLISKLPNVLCLQLKRFIYSGQLIKKKEFVEFNEVIEMPDSILSSKLRMGVFNSSKKASKPQYRLFSVVEHIGYYAHRGHYVSHTMDS